MAQNKHLIISLIELLTEEKKVLSHGSSSRENTVRNWTSAPKHHFRNNRIPSMERKSRGCPGWGSRSWAGASGLPCCFKVRVVDGQGVSLGVEHPVLQGQHVIFTEQKIEVPAAQDRHTRVTGAQQDGTHSHLPGKSPPFPPKAALDHSRALQTQPLSLQGAKGSRGSAAANSQRSTALPSFPQNGWTWKDPESSSGSSPLPTSPWKRRLPPHHLGLTEQLLQELSCSEGPCEPGLTSASPRGRSSAACCRGWAWCCTRLGCQRSQLPPCSASPGPGGGTEPSATPSTVG